MTAQISETLIYGGKKIVMCTEPLACYLRQSDIEFESNSTALWRGYEGTWELRGTEETEQKLYLVGLSALDKETNRKLGLKDLFPEYPLGVFAHWFSGQIRLPQGAQLKYIHMGYASIYEYDLFMEFSRGVVTKQYAIHNKLPEVNVDDIEIPAFMKKGK